jgi:hypothetical protein
MLQRVKEKNQADLRKKHNGATIQAGAPVLRLRELSIGIVCVVILIMWPLFMVWKQIYIANMSVRDAALSDSLVTLNKQYAGLRLYSERLASTERIESIGRTCLGLEYPASGRIIVIREGGRAASVQEKQPGFFAVLRKTVSRQKG